MSAPCDIARHCGEYSDIGNQQIAENLKFAPNV